MKNSGQLSGKEHSLVIWATLLALFLGALDSLIMSAAMPMIVADLGGLHLYAWVYSAYFLARAVALPVFGKLADLYGNKNLFLLSIAIFILSSLGAGLADSMTTLVVFRVFQGIGSGGVFALVYIVLTMVSSSEKRAYTLSLASTVWGISSVIGPTLGGVIVTYFSWRWIFYINLPIGLASLCGVAFFLPARTAEEKGARKLDLAGLLTFSSFILGLMIIFIAGGQELPWNSMPIYYLAGGTVIMGILFILSERKAADPMIDLRFFLNQQFALGNGALFFASFTIFSFFAYAPLYIQGSLGMTPLQVGMAMVSLSLGWSGGAMTFGRKSKQGREAPWSVAGGIILLAGSLLSLFFNLKTTMIECFLVFFVIGVGMGFVSLATLILVQNSVEKNDLGVVTSLHQLGRSLGGTIGVAICGGMVTSRMLEGLQLNSAGLSGELVEKLNSSIESVLLPEFQMAIPEAALQGFQQSILSGVSAAFLMASLASFGCLLCCFLLARRQ